MTHRDAMTDPYAGLRPEVRTFLEWNAANAPGLGADVDALRAHSLRTASLFSIARAPVASVKDFAVDGTHHPATIRVYRPDRPIDRRSDRSVFFLHGGSWFQCDLETHDALCRQICNRTGMAVLSADYGRAPENPFPHQPNDCLILYEWTRQHAAMLNIDPDGIIVCGDSSGANLVAVLTHDLKAAGKPQPIGQILLYPSVALCKHQTYPSWKRYGSGFLIGERSLQWTKKLYLRADDDLSHPRVSPVCFRDFSGLPPALVITAQCDPIRDGGVEYAQCLQDGGTVTRLVEYEGSIHGFASHGIPTQTARRALSEISAFARAAG